MAGKAFKLDSREWDKTFPVYMQHTKRDLATVMNTKGFYIARRATVETAKANAGDIRKVWGARTVSSNRKRAEIAGKIINKIRGKRGEKGLYGTAMAEAVANMLVYRLRTIGFIRSGWIPAIKRLESLAEKKGAPRQDRKSSQYGQPKGGASPARSSWRVICTIFNTASTKRDVKQALYKYGGPGLQRAFDFETKSMKDYIARKLAQSAQKLGIKATT